MAPPTPLAPRGARPAPRRYRQGTRPPFAIRWYGATSLWGHFRNFVSTAIARESVDARDWMRPLDAPEMLESATRVLGVEAKGTLLESIDGPLWIDWVADTGDDRDVSQAVGAMVFGEYAVADGGGELVLPRGDVLLFGGDTAYPVATSDEIYRRLVEPWNELLAELDVPRDRPRLLLAIPGNHDWYDGLDGFGRLFRRRTRIVGERTDEGAPDAPRASILPGGSLGRLAHGLHLDEVSGAIDTVVGVARTTRALWRGTTVDHQKRLTLYGYEPIQESSFWALPLAPGLELWGVDRQLGRLDYRQRAYFDARRDAVGASAGVWLAAPDPALAFGEPWPFGQRILDGAQLSLERDRVLYQCGDMHQYERRVVGQSMHVIAGGGGAFLHGTRIVADPSPAAAAFPDRAASRMLALQVPWKLMVGRSGYLVHIAAALIAVFERAIGWHHRGRFFATSLAVSALVTWALYTIAGHQRAQPRRVLALALPFGVVIGVLPLVLSALLHRFVHVVPFLGRVTAMVIVYAYVAALLYGVFLAICALLGFEVQQVFTVLGHPGFKHFVRMRVSRDGTVDAWVIGKDDPLSADGPWLVDRFTWRGSAGAERSSPR